MFVKQMFTQAKFSPEKMAKATVAQGDFLFVGLNCFEPGQEHAPHTHENQDKLYLVLEGTGAIQVGSETEVLSAGDAAFAGAGVPHSVRNPGPERLVVMAVLGPGPKSGRGPA